MSLASVPRSFSHTTIPGVRMRMTRLPGGPPARVRAPRFRSKMAVPSEGFSSDAEIDGHSPARFSPVPYGEVGNRGGYDCEFVEPPPAAFQTDCPICLHVLREPCVISCPCGQKICRECVEQITEDDKPCPLCNKTDFTYLRDYGLERYLKAQEVWCSHKNDGCEWRGKLGEYEQHLNRNPSQENQLTGCQFVEIECENGCGERFQRRHIASHQNQECPERPFACEYCHEYESAFTDVTENHYFVCELYPVTCPNKCRKDPFKQQDIEKHIENECPLEEINCPLHYAGCKVRLPRKDMPEHMTDTVTHLTLLATVTQSLFRENQEVRQTTEDLKKENQKLQREVKELRAHKLGLPVEYRIMKSKGNVRLPSFFSHSHGYKMSIRVYPDGNGTGAHVSIFAYLMQGEYDDHLKWPFRGRITVQIVNQAGDHSHVERTAHYHDKTPDSFAGRVTDEETAKGRGFHRFLALTDLEYNPAKKTQYLKDDIIVVKVVNVSFT